MWFPNRFVTNRPVKAQMARSVKFNRKALMYYSTSENKGADQFRSYCVICRDDIKIKTLTQWQRSLAHLSH